jgi:hypothetical protein
MMSVSGATPYFRAVVSVKPVQRKQPEANKPQATNIQPKFGGPGSGNGWFLLDKLQKFDENNPIHVQREAQRVYGEAVSDAALIREKAQIKAGKTEALAEEKINQGLELIRRAEALFEEAGKEVNSAEELLRITDARADEVEAEGARRRDELEQQAATLTQAQRGKLAEAKDRLNALKATAGNLQQRVANNNVQQPTEKKTDK